MVQQLINGMTPDEINAKFDLFKASIMKNSDSLEMQARGVAGKGTGDLRNKLCFCESGKKFKKCCGA